MFEYLKWLLMGFFLLHVEGEGEGEPPPEGEPEGGEGDPPEGEGGGDVDPPEGEGDGDGGEEPPPQKSRAPNRVQALAQRTKDAEERAQRLAVELEVERRGRQIIQPTHEDRLAAQEEAKLKDPATTALEKWQIESNRTLRDNNRQSAQALMAARDMQDQTAYQMKAAKNARLASVSDEVEKEIGRIRASGQQVPPRQVVAAYILGNKLIEAPPRQKTPNNGADRGRPLNVRSDVRAGKPGKSSQLRARLENVQI